MIYVLWDLAAHEYHGPFVSMEALRRWAAGRIAAYHIETQSIDYPNSYNYALGWYCESLK